jgi:site-specific recombinase XerD
MDHWMPCLVRSRGNSATLRLGHPLVDDYLELVGARCRPNTLWARAYDLKVFFTVIDRDPLEVKPADVVRFVKSQRTPRLPQSNVVRLADGGSGLALSTVQRRLSTVAGFYAHLMALGEVPSNPVHRGLPMRSPVSRGRRVVPMVRPTRTLPRVLDPDEADALLAALRTWRDRAMVEAMLLGGLRRSEVLGLGLGDIRSAQRRVFIADGKGGHQRLVPISKRFFATLTHYLERERPATASDRVFVVLKGPNRGRPLSAKGLEEIITGARQRAALSHGTCHELRHTCFTRLREAGMALEAIQAQAGHRSIKSTQVYLHLANDWLAGEYRRAAEAIDAQHHMGRPGRAS